MFLDTASSRFYWVTEEPDLYLEASTGSIRTKVPLDRETRDLYLLNVRVYNGNSVGYCQVNLKNFKIRSIDNCSLRIIK